VAISHFAKSLLDEGQQAVHGRRHESRQRRTRVGESAVGGKARGARHGNAGEYDPAEYAFIPATMRDNPLYAKDESYFKTLRALPRALRQAFLEGDWDVFAGQYFDVLDRARHVLPSHTIQFDDWWPRWISIDWGFEHPSAVYWHSARPDGSILTYREFVQNHLSPRMLAAAIAERSIGRDAQPERIAEIFLSPDAFAERTADASIAEQLGDVLAAAGLPRPAPADNDRVGGWMLMYQMLESAQWQISNVCRRSRATP
jgi:hypothetical protein